MTEAISRPHLPPHPRPTPPAQPQPLLGCVDAVVVSGVKQTERRSRHIICNRRNSQGCKHTKRQNAFAFVPRRGAARCTLSWKISLFLSFFCFPCRREKKGPRASIKHGVALVKQEILCKFTCKREILHLEFLWDFFFHLFSAKPCTSHGFYLDNGHTQL